MSNVSLLQIIFKKVLIVLVFISFLNLNAGDKLNCPIKKFNPKEEKNIALTFDDGPNLKVTKELLKILKKHNVKATFFLIGKNIKKNPKLIMEYLKDGHEIGNHSMTHPHLSKLKSQADIEAEIKGTQELIKSFTGYYPKLFRAPYLDFDGRVLDVLRENFLTAYNATVYLDYKGDDSIADHAENAAAKVKPGMIILIHERPITLKFLDQFLNILIQKGFKFKTISEMNKISQVKY